MVRKRRTPLSQAILTGSLATLEDTSGNPAEGRNERKMREEKGLKDKVRETAEEAVETYSNQAAGRALMAAATILNPTAALLVVPLDLLMSTRAQGIFQKRMQLLFGEIQAEVAHLREEMIDRHYVESEEYFDLFFRAIEAAVKTRHQEKIRLYAKVLRGAAVVQDRGGDDPEEYLAILAELAPRELELAKALYAKQGIEPLEGERQFQRLARIDGIPVDRQTDGTDEEKALVKGWIEKINHGGWLPDPGEYPSVPKEDLPFVLLRLERTGLIKELEWGLGVRGGIYLITETFRKLMRYLELGNPSDLES